MALREEMNPLALIVALGTTEWQKVYRFPSFHGETAIASHRLWPCAAPVYVGQLGWGVECPTSRFDIKRQYFCIANLRTRCSLSYQKIGYTLWFLGTNRVRQCL